MTVSADGREARTHYEVIELFDDPQPMTHVICRLETGRTHQIRVHLRSINHPVAGDDTYGGMRPLLDLTRPFLHARRLRFAHPGTGEQIEFHSPLADDLQALLDTMSVAGR
jgi:23S rRNA pseudouridine1911/1915/1917 synthase